MASQDITTALPTELLTMVLEMQSHEDIMRAAQVSRRWRDSALGCEQFYIRFILEITVGALMIVPSSRIEQCARRIATSAPTPIHLRVNARSHPPSLATHPGIQRQFRDLLMQALPRIVDLSVQADRSEILNSTVSAMVDFKGHRLRKLEVCALDTNVTIITLPVGMLSGGTLKLHTLRLCSFDLPAPLASLSAVQRLELYWSPVRISDILCGYFPRLRYLHLECVTPVAASASNRRRVVVPSLQTLVTFTNVDTQLKEIDFSELETLLVAGTEDAALFLPRPASTLHLELRSPYVEHDPLISENIMDAAAHLSISPSTPTPQDTTRTHRTITFGLTVDPDTDALMNLNIFQSVVRSLALVDMAHLYICQLLCLDTELTQLETLRSNFHASYYEDEFFLVDFSAGRCPALQQLVIYSTNSSGNWRIPEDQLVTMCAELGLFEREAATQPMLLIQGLQLSYDEDSDDEALTVSDAFKSITIEPK